MESRVVVIGAGPAGLAISVSLSRQQIPYIILDKEDCSASLWKKHSYDRLHLHLAKQYCQLPYKPHGPDTPTFMPKQTFIQYIDDYVSENNVDPLFNRSVESAFFDQEWKKWKIEAKNHVSGETEIYFSNFLVVATGENNKGFIPVFPGMDSFPGEKIHSSEYKCGYEYNGKDVLVVGCGNSGMEISYDLANYGARTAIVVRSPMHVLTKDIVYWGMWLLTTLKLPLQVVDAFTILYSIFLFGISLSKYGIQRPSVGPFTSKLISGKAPVIDVGAMGKIKSGEIQVVSAIDSIYENMVEFVDGSRQSFDAIIFATGYRSAANDWLKDYHYIFNEEGLPKNRAPNHWKGENGIYCVGFSRNGLPGIYKDAIAVAEDISAVLGDRVVESLAYD